MLSHWALMDFSGSKIGGAHKNYPFPKFDKCQQAHMIMALIASIDSDEAYP